ncbi:MAG TPA: histidine phosphatase family protein [Actinomycetota bacterium]|nr:histidine phosphatase family protein [Actinomycetota bacterium]
MKVLDVLRHAMRAPDADRLSPEGRAQAEDLGRETGAAYDVIFVSPAERAAETAAWILRGAGRQLPDHRIVPGLAGKDETQGSAKGMAAGVRALLAEVPEDGLGLAVSHTPFVERAAAGLTGTEPPPFAECEGIRVRLGDDEKVEVEELRR